MQNGGMDRENAQRLNTESGLSWSRKQRLEFIDFRLQWEGQLNRSDLITHFGISVPQASHDISAYTEVAPENLRYDRSQRAYLATAEFKPMFSATQSQSLLAELQTLAYGAQALERSSLSQVPSLAHVPAPSRLVNPAVLSGLMKALRSHASVRVLYQSMSRENPSWRTLSPHAFAHDGYRWHVRAYCHERRDFRDFVMGRILEIEGSGESSPDPMTDREWQTWVNIVLAPHPGLSAGQKRVVELDYGMEDGTVRLPCRRSLLFYALQRFGLANGNEAAEQQVVLLNREELLPLMQQ